MWVLIDNYDSFTYMLHHYLQQCYAGECRVISNDKVNISTLKSWNPERIILSPGPETPVEAGITLEVVDAFHQEIPILGVCLGHQALGVYFGAELSRAPQAVHGINGSITFQPHPLFYAIPQGFKAMRYHSLCLQNLPQDLVPLAVSDDGVIQAIQHRQYKSIGVQFHPESIGTEYGLQLLKNWSTLN